MNFTLIFVFVALIMAISQGQSEADWLNEIGKKIERVGQQTRDATLRIAQQVANVVVISTRIWVG